MVKQKDIADALGISTVSVSNALSGRKGVSDEMRERILGKAREMGYDNTRYETKAAGGRVIGVLVAGRYIEVGTSFYWAMYQQVVFAAAAKNNLTMLEILGEEWERDRMLPRILKEGNVDGLIIIGKMEDAYIRKILESVQIPAILMDYHSDSLSCDSVMSDNYIGMYKMTRYLLKRGHRKLAYVGELVTNENLCDRYFGYRKGLEEWGIEIRPEWVIDDAEMVMGRKEVDLPEEMPTAFVCGSDLIASRVYDRLLKQGYRVPEDVSLVGYDDYLYGHELADRLTTCSVDMKAMAKEVIHLLTRKMNGEENRSCVRYLDSRIVERASVRTL
ncbi:MAG: LacI family DNA-binding transcriptional regulator [Eubacteriales bacterium]|nr:LacI family DNA-binding transcriptional regulator [Eubacteriales bacterium]